MLIWKKGSSPNWGASYDYCHVDSARVLIVKELFGQVFCYYRWKEKGFKSDSESSLLSYWFVSETREIALTEAENGWEVITGKEEVINGMGAALKWYNTGGDNYLALLGDEVLRATDASISGAASTPSWHLSLEDRGRIRAVSCTSLEDVLRVGDKWFKETCPVSYIAQSLEHIKRT